MRQPTIWRTATILAAGTADDPRPELEQALTVAWAHCHDRAGRSTFRHRWLAVAGALHNAGLVLANPTGVDPYPTSEQLPVGTVVATADRVWIRGPDRADVQPDHQIAKHVWQPGDYSHQQIDGFRHRNEARILRIGPR
jgi:hypothetical protein